jgi:hypothetical protein
LLLVVINSKKVVVLHIQTKQKPPKSETTMETTVTLLQAMGGSADL